MTATEPLYQRHLGEAWNRLPPAVRRMHETGAGQQARGRAEVVRGRSLLARLAAPVLRLPRAAADIPITVSFRPVERGEIWIRDFAGHHLATRQTEGRGGWNGLLKEQFGPVLIGMKCELEGQRLYVRVRRWSLLGVVLPLRMAPGGDAYESEQDGRFVFHIEMRHPLVGLIVRYVGWLEPDATGV